MRTSVYIAARPEQVWPFFADPSRHASWNPKVVAVTRKTVGPARLGERFEMTYRLGSMENHVRVEVTTSRPFERIAFLQRRTWKSVERQAEERYDVVPRGLGVTLTQTIDFSAAGVPWFVRGLLWVFRKIGTPSGPQPLEVLKRLAEEKP